MMRGELTSATGGHDDLGFSLHTLSRIHNKIGKGKEKKHWRCLAHGSSMPRSCSSSFCRKWREAPMEVAMVPAVSGARFFFRSM